MGGVNGQAENWGVESGGRSQGGEEDLSGAGSAEQACSPDLSLVSRSALRAWSRLTRSCWRPRTGCSRRSPRYQDEQSQGRRGGDRFPSTQRRSPAPCPGRVCSRWAVQTEPPSLMLSLQALLAVKPVAVEEEQEPEVPTNPEDGTPQPGNSKVRRGSPRMGRQ